MNDLSPVSSQTVESILATLPDPDAARRFHMELSSRHPAAAVRLEKDVGLLSDVLTLSSFSPLLSTTLLQHPEYLQWLSRHRSSTKTRSKEELLESLARFALTNSDAEPQVLLARFRRRELLRIFLLDIRRLTTIAETTEEISNLADSILEHALGIANQDLENRFGSPLTEGADGRLSPAHLCVVSLGKLGSRELNYSSDIDLVFLYSGEGTTSGSGSRGPVTNREFFSKLAERLIKLVGGQAGEGAAYRVDMRLRPHGRVGALAVSVEDAVGYYGSEARDWERQVLIRSRASAGEEALFEDFIGRVSHHVYSKDQTVEDALRNVRQSKEKIDREHQNAKGYNVKLGRGGIREIEFIAQALQLAHGSRDKWLRNGHTLISISRAADRGLLSAHELTQLHDAYGFLRQVEHILQMEHGLQTHIVPEDPAKRDMVARRMGSGSAANFDVSLAGHCGNVSRIFARVFGETATSDPLAESAAPDSVPLRGAAGSEFGPVDIPLALRQMLDSIAKAVPPISVSRRQLETLGLIADRAPHFAEMVAAYPALAYRLPDPETAVTDRNCLAELSDAVGGERDFRGRLATLRKTWLRLILEIAVLDIDRRIDTLTAKVKQTRLAEASMAACLDIAIDELSRRARSPRPEPGIAFLGLGKLGGMGVDYGSDLDIVAVYDDSIPSPAPSLSSSEYHSKLVELFTETIGGVTRDGQLYRVDLRLRPNGKSGPLAIGASSMSQYFENKAAIWEWLAYLKVRSVGGDSRIGGEVERKVRSTIHRRALETPRETLASETIRIREGLLRERGRVSNAREIDIKFGAGGLLDIYFATRFLQLVHGIEDDHQDRSTGAALSTLSESGVLAHEDHSALSEGYSLLSSIDHTVRLAVGRSTRVSFANHEAMRAVCRQTGFSSVEDLAKSLERTQSRVRSAFLRVVR